MEEEKIYKFYINFLRFLKEENLWGEFLYLMDKERNNMVGSNYYDTIRTCILKKQIHYILWCEDYSISWWSSGYLKSSSKLKWSKASEKLLNFFIINDIGEKERNKKIINSIINERERTSEYENIFPF